MLKIGKVKANFLRHEGYLGAIGAFLKGCEAEVADIEILKPFENLENCSWTENLYGSTPSFNDPLTVSGQWQAGSLSSDLEGCRKRTKSASASMGGKLSLWFRNNNKDGTKTTYDNILSNQANTNTGLHFNPAPMPSWSREMFWWKYCFYVQKPEWGHSLACFWIPGSDKCCFCYHLQPSTIWQSHFKCWAKGHR